MTSPYADGYLLYRHAGWTGTLPVPARQKTPPPEGFTGWDGYYPSGADAHAFTEEPRWSGANLVLRMPPIVIGIDIDAYPPKTGAATLTEAQRRWGPLPTGPWSSARDDGVSGIRFFRVPDGTVLQTVITFPELSIGHIEVIQRHHRYAVVWPSIHPTGALYTWRGADGEVLAQPPSPDDLPPLPEAWLRALAGTGTNAERACPEQVTAFFAALPTGDPCTTVVNRLKEAAAALRAPVKCRHDDTTKNVLRLLRLGEQGHPGVPAALAELREVFIREVSMDGSRTHSSAEAEFDRMQEGERGVGLIQANPTNPADRGCRCQLPGEDARNGSGGPPPGEGPDSQATPSRLGVVLKRSELASLPSVRPLIEGVMSTPASVILVGGYGLGKTFLALSCAASVATGRDWLGRRVQRCRVLFVIGEGAYGLDPRVCAWEAAWNGGAPVSDDDLTFIVKPGSLNDAATWQELVRFATDGGYGLVVLDTFSSLAPDADETKDAARMTRRLSDLSTTINGCALLVHHPGWSDAGRSRGGYQLEANTDEVLILAGVGAGTNQVTLTRKKVKDGPDGAVLWLRRTAAHGSVIIEGSRADDVAAPLRARIRAVLANCGEVGASGPQLMAELGIEDKGRSGFYAALRKLDEDGLVRSEGQRQRKRYYQVSPL